MTMNTLLQDKTAALAEQREQTVQSNLARLLANENLHVTFRKASTASFNVKTRVLIIPIYSQDLSKEVVQMLVGHEVGHALWTPEQGWHGAVSERGLLYKSYLNVVEDARIERKIKDKYPGLNRDFYFGYLHLVKAGFFGRNIMSPSVVNEMSLIDRINLHFKASVHIPSIRFTETEMDLVDRVQEAETWDDVLAATDAVWNYDKQWRAKRRAEEQAKAEALRCQQEEEDDGVDDFDPPEPQPQPNADEEDDLSDMDDEGSEQESVTPDDEEDADEESADSDDTDADSEESDDDEDSDESDDDEDSEESDDDGKVAVEDDDEGEELPQASETDTVFRSKEAELLDPSSRDILTVAFDGLPIDAKKVTVPFKRVQAFLEKQYQRDLGWISDDPARAVEWSMKEEAKFFAEFRAKHERYITHLVREFELRKNAWTTSRSREARSGALNLTKMYQYKFNDDLFKKVTMVPQGKNHAMVMIVDGSGSMSEVLPAVMEQAAVLSTFCRRVNIPFRVLMFSNIAASEMKRMFDVDMPDPENTRVMRYVNRNALPAGEGKVFLEGFSFFEMLSDKMTLREFNRAVYFYCSKPAKRTFGAIPLSSTPLNESILSIPSIVANIKKETGAQKVSIIVLTDGESDTSNIMIGGPGIDPARTRIFVPSPWTKKVFELLPQEQQPYGWNPKPYKSFSTLAHTKLFIQMAEEASGATIVGYHVVDGRTAGKMLAQYNGYYTKPLADMKIEFRNQRVMSINEFGYKEYFILWDKALTSEDKTLQGASSDMTARKIAAVFVDAQKSKTVNRVFLTKFVGLIA